MAIGDMFGDLCKIDILAKSAKPMKFEWKLKPRYPSAPAIKSCSTISVKPFSVA